MQIRNLCILLNVCCIQHKQIIFLNFFIACVFHLGNRKKGLTKTEGTQTFALKKRLYMSGHVRELQYHGISGNVSYCFVWEKVSVCPEVSCWTKRRKYFISPAQKLQICDLAFDGGKKKTKKNPVHQSVKSSSTVTSEAMLNSLHISKHQQEVLAKQTSQQASSSVWADHQKGRITASVAGDCAGSIKNGTVPGHSPIARVMRYYSSQTYY